MQAWVPERKALRCNSRASRESVGHGKPMRHRVPASANFVNPAPWMRRRLICGGSRQSIDLSTNPVANGLFRSGRLISPQCSSRGERSGIQIDAFALAGARRPRVALRNRSVRLKRCVRRRSNRRLRLRVEFFDPVMSERDRTEYRGTTIADAHRPAPFPRNLVAEADGLSNEKFQIVRRVR